MAIGALSLAPTSSAMTLIFDIDHLPGCLGYAQPIRPAHSLTFVLAVSAIMAITIKALDTDLIVLSAFLGHLAVDAGLFGPFSPISSHYILLNPGQVPLAAGGLPCAFAAAGVMKSRNMHTSGGPR